MPSLVIVRQKAVIPTDHCLQRMDGYEKIISRVELPIRCSFTFMALVKIQARGGVAVVAVPPNECS